MYEELASLALFVFLYSPFVGRVERGFVSGPIVLVAPGTGMSQQPYTQLCLQLPMQNSEKPQSLKDRYHRESGKD